MVNVQERRLVLRMLAYWSDLKGERDFPTLAEIDAKDIGEDWRFCALVALDHDLPRSRLLTVGNDLAPVGAPLPDTLGKIPPGTLLAAAVERLDWMLLRRVPLSLGGQLDRADGPFLYRKILLPLSTDGAEIDHVLVVANGRPLAVDAGS